MKNSLKILVVTTGYPRYQGDIFGNFVQETVHALAESGYQISVLAPHEKGLPFKKTENGVCVYRLPYLPFPFLQSFAYGSGIPSNMKKLSIKWQLPFFLLGMMFWTLILAFKHRLIHCQWSISGSLALITRLFHRKPIVTTYHGSDLNATGLLKKLSHFVAKYSDQNICISNAQQKILEPIQSEYCPYLVDTDRFIKVNEQQKQNLKQQYGFAKYPKLIIYVGSLIPVKQPHLLVEVIQQLGLDYHLIWAGEGLLKDEILELMKTKGLEEQITLLGHVPYQDIHVYFQMADLHVLTSKSEGRPNVIYQAMASSIPSISTPVGGVPEMIEDGVSGKLVEANASLLTKAIEEVFKDRETLLSYGEKAKEKLKSLKSDKESVVKKHTEIYRAQLIHSS